MATGTLGTTARDYPWRLNTALNAAITAANINNLSVKIGTIPAGAVITGVRYGTSVAFNGTTPTVRVGITPNGAELVAAATFGAALGLTAATLIATAAGPLAADTPVYASGVFGGSNTLGAAVLFVEYLIPGG